MNPRPNKTFTTVNITKDITLLAEKLTIGGVSAESWLILLLAFLMPIHQPLASFTSIVLFAVWSLGALTRRSFNSLKTRHFNLSTILFAALFLAYLAGAFYSSNFDETCFDLQVKLSLAAFPLIFSFTALTPANFKKTQLAFLAGMITSAFIILVKALVKYGHQPDAGYFYYRELADTFHPTYLAMYAGFAMMVVAERLRANVGARHARNLVLIVLGWLFLFFLTILLSSKAGIIAMAVAMVYTLVIIHLHYRSSGVTASATLFMAMLFLASVYLFPRSFGRMTVISKSVETFDQTDGNNAESNFQRIVIWKSAAVIIQNHWLTGVGTGDVKDALTGEFEKSGNQAGLKAGLNVHNQYLQTAIALGIPGLLLLAVGFLIPFLIALKRRFLLYQVFLIIVAFNLLFESMLERQAGVMFYAFFNSLLFGMMMNHQASNQSITSPSTVIKK